MIHSYRAKTSTSGNNAVQQAGKRNTTENQQVIPIVQL